MKFQIVLMKRKIRLFYEIEESEGTELINIYCQLFFNGVEFKEVVIEYALNSGNNVVQGRWEKTRLEFKCGVVGKCSCRPIIGLDGTFLKTAVKGVLLAAIGHDANNQIYPLAWAVGLISSVQTELPKAEHRFCQLAWSYNKTEFKENLNKVKEYNVDVYDSVIKKKPETCSRAFFKLGSNCEDVDNNATESFNASITKERDKAMIPMLETVRRQAMHQMVKRHNKSKNHEGRFTEYVAKILAEQKKDANKCDTTPSTHGVYEVMLYGNKNSVNTKRRTCTCGKWQISGIPCEHAYGAMIDYDMNVEDYVSGFFSTDLWRDNYEQSIHPMRGPRFWMTSMYRLVTAPPEPILPGKKKQIDRRHIKGLKENTSHRRRKQ
ncbi:PREDICTED: uncharacterized protein LOC104727518 [Camelina sativa]|uniref:Uncharacterized protein LOC104727518 n=1 Tax=Camelina sativa TaxID=90675 RepID=A0ABM1QKI3_CAMSA|nr:PREDICTED: uncharacterized protein LOC104727518 [Camelina sativa]